jgi:hypothetical protein
MLIVQQNKNINVLSTSLIVFPTILDVVLLPHLAILDQFLF